MLCVVDDAHWLDPATCRTRCCSAPAGSARTGCCWCSPPATRPRRRSRRRRHRRAGAGRPRPGRGPGPAGAAARARTRAEDVTERLVVETGGNPLALLELPDRAHRRPARRVRPAADPAAPAARVEQAFLDRSRRLSAAGAVRAAARGRRRHRRPRGHPCRGGVPRLDEDALEAAVGVGAAGRGRPDGAGASSAGALGDLPGRHRASSDDALTERWPRPWPESETPTGRPGTAPPPPRGPTHDVVAALERVGSRAERRGAYVSALAAYERAAALTTGHAAAGRADARGRPERVGVRADRPSARRCWPPPAHRRRSGAARRTSPACRARSRPTSARRPTRTRIFVEAAHAVHDDRPHAPSTKAVLAAIMRTYGADSGTPLPMAGDIDVDIDAGDPPRTRVPQAHAGRDDPRRRTATGREPCLHWTSRWQPASRWRTSTCSGTSATRPSSSATTTPSSTSTAWRSPGPGRPARSWWSSTPAAAVLRAPASPATGRPCAAVPRRRSRSAQGLGQTALTALPLALLTLLAAAPGPRRLRRPAARRSRRWSTRYPLGILTDPVHDLTRWAKGAQAAAARRRLRRPAPLLPDASSRAGADGGDRAHRRRRPRRRDPTWPGLGRRAAPSSPRPPVDRGRWPRSPSGAR